MLRNYLKIAFRTLRRHVGYTTLNVAGLAVGMAACLLIGLYVRDELSYDRFHAEADRIYRVVEDHRGDDGEMTRAASTPSRLAPTLRDAFPAVEEAVRLYPYDALLRRDAERAFQEERFFFADSAFFDLFSFPFQRGDAATALDEPFSLVLTASAAAKYFPDTHPLGQTLRLDNRHTFTVTGIVEDVPPNAHFSFDVIASYTSLRDVERWVMNDWHYPPMYTYVLLAEGADAGSLAARFAAFEEQHFDADEAASRSFQLQPLTAIHLHSQREQEIAPTGNVAYVYLFSVIAGFILLIACVNFMNLATARAARRAREVGVRKVLGAQRRQLIQQFLGESLLTAAFAFAAALLLAGWVLPVFNTIAGKALAFADLLNGPMLGVAAALVVLVGLLAGSYPALYLAAFRPAQVLGATVHDGWLSASSLRRGLIVIQFAVAIILIVGTGITYQQLNYVQHKRLGFDEERIVVVPLRDEVDQQNHPALKERWLQHPGVEHVTASSGVPGRSGIHHFQISQEASPDSLYAPILAVDPDFAETFGVEVVAGRDFSSEYGTDTSSAFVVNEAAVERMGWSTPVGEPLALTYKGPSGRFTTKSGEIIGVIENFHYHSLHRSIEPLLLHVVPPSFYNDYLSIRIAPGQTQEVIAFLEDQWAAFSPGRPFEYSFLDVQLDAQYRAERRFGWLVSVFAGLAIVIACLGLFSLAAFMAEQRTKEIGLRKALGASMTSIVGLLSTEFAQLVLAAFVVAAPVAYWAMQQWLNDFAYRIDVGPGIFIGAGVLAMGAALLTVSYQAIKAARVDPVKALRTE